VSPVLIAPRRALQGLQGADLAGLEAKGLAIDCQVRWGCEALPGAGAGSPPLRHGPLPRSPAPDPLAPPPPPPQAASGVDTGGERADVHIRQGLPQDFKDEMYGLLAPLFDGVDWVRC
jgi:hypothetical protein